MVQPIPPGFSTFTPSFTFKDAAKAIEFYERAFNAQVIDRLPGPDGKSVMHASLKIGESMMMLGNEMPGSEECSKSAETLGQCPITLYLYVPDADRAFEQAVSAGATAAMAVTDMFWGDRAGMVKDPFGYSWMIATHIKDMSAEEVKQAAADFFKQQNQTTN